MRAVITGTDFVRDVDGSFKTIETNTNIHPAVNPIYYFDVNILDTIISGTNINEIHFINKRGLRGGYNPEVDLTPEEENARPDLTNLTKDSNYLISTYLNDYCTAKGFTFNNIILDTNTITIPHIEDSDTKLIIRIAYDVTALIDDTYARDNWEFLKLMYDSNPTSIPKTYINDAELGFDSIGTILRDNGNHPNYCVKKRITPADNHTYPKLYKVTTIEQLNEIKSALEADEYLQEYILNNADLLDNRLTHYRSVDLIYGPELDVLNLWCVQFSNAFELDNICDLDDENKIQLWERPKYFYKYNNNEKAPKISADGSTKVFLPDNSLTLLSSLNQNDTVKSISIPGLSTVEADNPDLIQWTGSFSNIMENFSIGTTQLTNIVKREDYTGFFFNVNLTDGVKFSDVGHAIIMKKDTITNESGVSEDVVKWVDYVMINPGDSLILFDSQTNSLVVKEVESVQISYDKVEVYAVNFEELDLFLTSEEGANLRYGLLTHNYSFDCKSVTAPCVYCCACGAPGITLAFWSNLQCCKCDGPAPAAFACSAQGFSNFGTCYQYFYPSFCSGNMDCITAGYCNYNKSDIIHKEDIQLIGKSESGINIYQFKYKDEDGLYEGVIGNELIGTEFENAVTYDPNDGTILVDYYKIDVQFKKLN